MTDEVASPSRMYWRYVWRNRAQAKVFSLYRAVPAFLVSAIQFFWRRTAQTSLKDLWISLTVIAAVYLGLFLLNSLWSFVVLTPPKIYSEQLGVIQEWIGRCGALEREREVSPTEQRRREQVQKVWSELTPDEKAFVRFVFDRGEVNSSSLNKSGLNQSSLYDAIIKAINSGLLMHRRDAELSTDFWKVDKLWVNPSLKNALEFVLSQS